MRKLLIIGVAVATVFAASNAAHAQGFGIPGGIAGGIIAGIIASQIARPHVVYVHPRVRYVRPAKARAAQPASSPRLGGGNTPPRMDDSPPRMD